ncbi:adenosylcobyric acid synthase (glutamine-hydrolysing) [Ectothiorhodosinus mongolicus]|uniref:Cobyric acid synthase n=2 Tax=Ectothiorhodosinus mongolicus TaxID=233100 RepID=A0A1R3VX34_9GAMM|nr:adenosylcobyric acid synthase (glutamine-hydrolysing) [Ectothiorhodosinus mongolicus]
MINDPEAAIDFPSRPELAPRRSRALMIQGTSSDVGKSLLVAGLCRAYTRRGLTVRPFKAQNMSNNAAVTSDCDPEINQQGETQPHRGEIGRAQALQARACGVAPSIHMNPVLLKPQTTAGSQVVLRGRVLGTCRAKVYHKMKPQLLPAVVDSFHRVAAQADLVLVEGAGSGAEVYLRKSDITNMKLANLVDLPVVLLGDIDRGGALAAIVGTHALYEADERARVVGYIINKFRGDLSLFEPAMELMTERTGWPSLGVLRWFDAAAQLPAEDSLALERPAMSQGGSLNISIPQLSRVANFDDMDPLAAEPGVHLRWVKPGQSIPRDTDVIILPGSKSTRGDLDTLRREGWDIDIQSHVRQGGRVVGLCAGYQMLGKVIRDPSGIEGEPGETPGLGLLDLETEMTPDKQLLELHATETFSGCSITGYEMHMGRTQGPGLEKPWLRLSEASGTVRDEGAITADGLVSGAYVHGIFGNDDFRRHWLAQVGGKASDLAYEARIEAALDALADHCEANLDLDSLLSLAR